jgi:hypothetical protein
MVVGYPVAVWILGREPTEHKVGAFGLASITWEAR